MNKDGNKVTFISPKNGVEYVIDQTIMARSGDGSRTIMITPDSGLDYELALAAMSEERIARLGKQLSELRQAIGRYQFIWLNIDDYPGSILHNRREDMFATANIDPEFLSRLAPGEK